jgi:hypothetical protein
MDSGDNGEQIDRRVAHRLKLSYEYRMSVTSTKRYLRHGRRFSWALRGG